MPDNILHDPLSSEIFLKETLIKGEPRQIRCVEIDDQVFSISSGSVRIVSLEDDWYEDVEDPEAIIRKLRERRDIGADIFTFWQRPPDVEPRFTYAVEYDELAVLPITTYEDWWSNRIKSRIRTTIRKAEKQGITVKEMAYDDEFIGGMTEIFNEAPVRQGRRFWHFGKDFETVRQQFSRYVHRERMIGAFFEGKMIGFIMLGEAGRFALLGQILSSLEHRDKSPNNLLIAKAVDVCASHGLSHLVYWYWSDDSLAEFKRRCGFEKVAAPRYFVPLSIKGRLALRLGAHHGLAGMIPARLKRPLKRLRTSWYGARAQ